MPALTLIGPTASTITQDKVYDRYSAMYFASSSGVFGITTAISSPPYLPAKSVFLMFCLILCATVLMISSPFAWP